MASEAQTLAEWVDLLGKKQNEIVALRREVESLKLDIEIYQSIESCLKTILMSCRCAIGNDVY